MISCTDTLNTVQMKRVVQMLLAERHKSVLTFNQIGNDHVPVIITVDVEHSENGIGLVLRKDRHDGIAPQGMKGLFVERSIFLCYNSVKTDKIRQEWTFDGGNGFG